MRSSSTRSPLFADAGLFDCRHLNRAEVRQTLRRLVAEASATVKAISAPSTPSTWAGVVAPLEDIHDRLSQAWGRIEHLHNVINDPKWRKIVDENSDTIVDYWTALDQNRRLYKKYQTFRASAEYRRLNPAQRRVVDLNILDAQLAGAGLPARDKRRLAQLVRSLSKLSKKFSNRAMDATNAIQIDTTNKAEIAGIPAAIVATARQRAATQRRAGWIFSIQGAEPGAILRTAESRGLRQRVYQAVVRNASELGPARFDTTPVIRDILMKRQELARLLGFGTYAELSLYRKMASRPSRAEGFMRRIARRVIPQARGENKVLGRFARRHLRLSEVKPWDRAYVADQLRAKKFGFTNDQLRRYFPLPAVLATLEDTVRRSFGVRLRRARHFRPYHPDVWRYDVLDVRGQLLGQVVMDLVSRPTKRAGAWAGEDTSRRVIDGRVRPAVSNCVCNFLPPDKSGVVRLTHDDVHTLFHEFGHIVNHILSTVSEPRVGGTAGVEWDAVELPSQWMQRFTYEPTVLKKFHAFGAPALPPAATRQILAANRYLSGLFILRQIRFGMFDLALHQVRRPGAATALKVWRAASDRYDVSPLPRDDRFPNMFHHLFDGGYAAGYYSYLWAEVMAADAFEPLRNRPAAWRRWGQSFRTEILAPGGSVPAAQRWQAFRGRVPRIQPLFTDYGLRRA